jgi:tRNA nucleotidyltransferase (CCA-adding enzyme)
VSEAYLQQVASARLAGQVYRRPLGIALPERLVEALHANARRMRALVVGGSVRDAVLGHEPKDIDVEVYGMSYEDLAAVLERHGRMSLVGKQFGVIKFRDGTGGELDISIPRRESKTGVGHTDFATSFDPDIHPREAAARRDFTVNALAWDPLTQEIHDYFGGVDDLRAGVLRATSPAFAEDALRVLRGMQFSARFDMRLDPATAELSRTLLPEYAHLSRERVAEEWMKLAVKGKRPGLLWAYLIETGWIELYPPLARLVGVPQDPEWHPEGPVDVHVGHVLDAMARIADREGVVGDDRAVLVFAALTHDLAKSFVRDGGTTAQRRKRGRLRWTAHGHEEAGGPMAREFLASIGIKASIVERVVPLVENHLQHIRAAFDGAMTVAAVRQLADRLAPATVRELALLIEADQSGRPPLPGGLPQPARHMLGLAEQEGIAGGPPPRLIQGRDVLPYFGGAPGPHIGKAVVAAHEAYLKGVFSAENEARVWLKNYLESEARLVRGSDVLAYVGKPGPHVGTILKSAWEAQIAGEFSDRAGAEQWLRRYVDENGVVREALK